jgi:hypothetical protein
VLRAAVLVDNTTAQLVGVPGIAKQHALTAD